MPPRKTKAAAPAPATPSAIPAAPAAPTTPAAPAVSRSETKGSGTAKAAPTTSAPRQITDEMIARRAFEIYAGRGYAAGDQDADWHEAERQLRAGL
jgi:hypothetical protein